jgi:hypothetical protein
MNIQLVRIRVNEISLDASIAMKDFFILDYMSWFRATPYTHHGELLT